jgi:hypothetical protein
VRRFNGVASCSQLLKMNAITEPLFLRVLITGCITDFFAVIPLLTESWNHYCFFCTLLMEPLIPEWALPIEFPTSKTLLTELPTVIK